MIDLTNIPEHFHILFTTDWNQGIDSTMTNSERTSMNDLFLEYHHWDVKNKIDSMRDKPEETPFQGFPKI